MNRPSTARRLLLHGIAGFGIGLGLLFAFVDDLDARAEKQAVERIVGLPEDLQRGTVWFVGHWGFQFYAEHAGMRPVVPRRSRLRRWDWLAVPDQSIDQQRIRIDPTSVRLIHQVEVQDRVPLRTVPGYYNTWSSAFLEHRRGPRLTLQVYEVITDFTP